MKRCGSVPFKSIHRFFSLSRRSRQHHRQVFKEEEEAIRVDVHEGCGRTKLFWLMALADSKTLKGRFCLGFKERSCFFKAFSHCGFFFSHSAAMVEFRAEPSAPSFVMKHSHGSCCRFCGNVVSGKQ